ncbi:MAG: H-NS histone family protein [Actinomycetaceae bacterium]|nr:H-NS histone family protein [Actinomycetaceae bacterium]
MQNNTVEKHAPLEEMPDVRAIYAKVKALEALFADVSLQLQNAREELAVAVTTVNRIAASYSSSGGIYEANQEENNSIQSKQLSDSSHAQSKVAAKYRDPVTGQTWSGRGRTPLWLVGKDKGQFLISTDGEITENQETQQDSANGVSIQNSTDNAPQNNSDTKSLSRVSVL